MRTRWRRALGGWRLAVGRPRDATRSRRSETGGRRAGEEPSPRDQGALCTATVTTMDLHGHGRAACPAPSSSAFACFEGVCLLRRRATAHRDNPTRGDDNAIRRALGSIPACLWAPSKHGASSSCRNQPLRDPISARGSSIMGDPDMTPSRPIGGASLGVPNRADSRSWSILDVASFFEQHTAKCTIGKESHRARFGYGGARLH
jgi:hypothetical protein